MTLSPSFGESVEPDFFFAHRAAAAFLAIAFRFGAVNVAALAGPPFAPPSFPSATAAGFFCGSGGGGGALPVAVSTMNLAS